MTDLRLVAVTPERSHLVLEDAESNQFRVPIDERLANALRDHRSSRGPQKSGQLEIALESQLTPREIQARIRAGRSLEEVAAAAGIATERVERYAAPVLAEREHVADQAKLAPARRASAGSAPRLGELVEQRLAQQSVAADSVTWDAWRGEDDRWTVNLSYLAVARERNAQWTFDPRGRVLAAANDEARWLVDETAPERGEDGTPTPVRRLASVPVAEGHDDTTAAGSAESADEVYDREADEGRHEPARQVARAGRRPAVPSWDDIMFGARRRD
jgi:DNA-binding CsgD family transcriptional regulator